MSTQRLMKKRAAVTRAMLLAVVGLLLGGWLPSARVEARGDKAPRAEDLVEKAINSYGGRAALFTIQRNGILRAQIKLTNGDSKREGRTITRFIRKPKLTEDLVMIELDLPDTKFTIGYDGQKIWSLQNGEAQEATPEMSAAFRSSFAHSYEALLRYKEDGGKLELVTTNKIGNLEMDVIDLTALDGTRTRYTLSRRTGHILFLEYESKAAPDAKPNKYKIAFSDFQVIQNTLVPYKTVVFENGVQVEERKMVEVAYSVQLDEKSFKSENAGKPLEAAAKP